MTTLCTVNESNRVMSSARVTMAVNVIQLHRTHTGTGNAFAWDTRWSDFVVAPHRKSTGPSLSEPSTADTPVTNRSMDSEPTESQTNTGTVLELFGATWGRSGGSRLETLDVTESDATGRTDVRLAQVIPFAIDRRNDDQKVGLEAQKDNPSTDLSTLESSWMALQFNRNRGRQCLMPTRGRLGRVPGGSAYARRLPPERDNGTISGSLRMMRVLLGFNHPVVTMN